MQFYYPKYFIIKIWKEQTMLCPQRRRTSPPWGRLLDPLCRSWWSLSKCRGSNYPLIWTRDSNVTMNLFWNQLATIRTIQTPIWLRNWELNSVTPSLRLRRWNKILLSLNSMLGWKRKRRFANGKMPIMRWKLLLKQLMRILLSRLSKFGSLSKNKYKCSKQPMKNSWKSKGNFHRENFKNKYNRYHKFIPILYNN